MADPSGRPPGPTTNLPFYSLIAAVLFVALAVLALVFVPRDDTRMAQLVLVIGLIVTTVPSLIASAFAERTSRDVRNGVLVDQVKTGTKQALVEHNVVTRDGPYVAATTQALLDILQDRHGQYAPPEPRTPPDEEPTP